MNKILIVEGNLKEENKNFSNAGIQTHTESLKDSLSYLTNDLALDVVNPSSDVDRHVLVLGADPIVNGSRSGSIDPLLIAFSDQENIDPWFSELVA